MTLARPGFFPTMTDARAFATSLKRHPDVQYADAISDGGYPCVRYRRASDNLTGRRGLTLCYGPRDLTLGHFLSRSLESQRGAL